MVKATAGGRVQRAADDNRPRGRLLRSERGPDVGRATRDGTHLPPGGRFTKISPLSSRVGDHTAHSDQAAAEPGPPHPPPPPPRPRDDSRFHTFHRPSQRPGEQRGGRRGVWLEFRRAQRISEARSQRLSVPSCPGERANCTGEKSPCLGHLKGPRAQSLSVPRVEWPLHHRSQEEMPYRGCGPGVHLTSSAHLPLKTPPSLMAPETAGKPTQQRGSAVRDEQGPPGGAEVQVQMAQKAGTDSAAVAVSYEPAPPRFSCTSAVPHPTLAPLCHPRCWPVPRPVMDMPRPR
ncbi:hypothetical protein SKAU_G00176800 [Synaphobranchus kaupii]|uniref:Uncharacterized protein n=1 Tax=Synaphobranchus kaupii TaxID=118154 RepID=A0A9Q1J1A1_SYNKA|nr:hypothetical protein SKAU_G00176800 [Synaphobranchus kaupii]